MYHARTDPFQTGRVRSGSNYQICSTRPGPPRFLFKRVRSGPFKFGPGPARAHPYSEVTGEEEEYSVKDNEIFLTASSTVSYL